MLVYSVSKAFLLPSFIWNNFFLEQSDNFSIIALFLFYLWSESRYVTSYRKNVSKTLVGNYDSVTTTFVLP